MTEALTFVLGFFLGSLPIGLWWGQVSKGIDVREHGSGNIGATNVYRTLGAKAALGVLVLDAGKGALGPLFALILEAADWWIPIVGVAAVLGHCFSPFLFFRGGRGIATSLGVLLVLDWRVGLSCLGVWIIIIVATRYVSVGSIAACLCVPLTFVLFEWVLKLPAPAGTRLANLIAGSVVAGVAIARHGPNIKRLARGEEHRIGGRPGPPKPEVRPGETDKGTEAR